MRLRHLATVARHLVKNAAAPALIPLIPNRRLGVDGDPAAALAALDDLAPAFGAVRETIDGASVLELGPGKTAELSGALLLAGARKAMGLDTRVSLISDRDAREPLEALAAQFASGSKGSAFLRAVDRSSEAMAGRVAAVAEGPSWPLPVHDYDGVHVPLADDSVDLAFSKSVFEHVPLGTVEPLLRELRRVVRPSGAAVHAIDLRDHLHITSDHDVVDDWLEALTYPPRLFRAMFSRRSVYINRLRADAWRAAFARTGWEIEAWNDRRWALPPGWSRDGLEPTWRDVPMDVLEVGFFWVALRPAGASVV